MPFIDFFISDDIQVRFFEIDPNNAAEVRWEAYADFGHGDVHRQVSFAPVMAQAQPVGGSWHPEWQTPPPVLVVLALNLPVASSFLQFAIVFKTPSYRDLSIRSPAQVQLQLKRTSDGQVSDPKPFQFIPDDPGW